MTPILKDAKRIVVKIGSSLLIDPHTDQLNKTWLKTVIEDISHARKQKQDVLVVSSGAIALGRRSLGLPRGVLKLEHAQAAAAAGQIRLAHAYEELAAGYDIPVAQILLTLGDTEERRRFLNARSTIRVLLKHGALPVINENDTIATSEIRYGDNDRLAARVAQMTGADCLILLSDVDGLYTADPASDSTAEHISEVDLITPQIEQMASDWTIKTATRMGSGGMRSKLSAAKVSTSAGCNMVIANGHIEHPLRVVAEGGKHTLFRANQSGLAARKQWIAGSLKPEGRIYVDDGAVTALQRGKSLLPAGVGKIEGEFERGDAIVICDASGTEIARGLTAYSSGDAEKIKLHKSDEIEALLGYRGRDEIVHRDDLVMTEVHVLKSVGKGQ